MSNITRRSFVVGSGATALVAALAGCSGGETAEGSGAGSAAAATGGHIYVLTASPDHGWTGQVGVFAQEKVDEINDAGAYTAELQTAGAAADQIAQVEDILAGDLSNVAGIVIQPLDDTVQSAIQQIVDAGVPYVAFDRIIEAVQDSAVANVKGDNSGIGAGSAAYFVENGMNPGDAAIKKSGAMNWSRSDTKAAFESLLGDEANAQIKWWYAEDDELAMGILEALNGGGITDATKEVFYETKPYITGCGGLNEYYEVIRGNSYQDITENLGGVMSVTYSPSMIQTAIQDMVDHLDGKEVPQDHVIACENVTAENVDDYVGFE